MSAASDTTNIVLRALLEEEREARDKVFAFLVAENQQLRDFVERIARTNGNWSQAAQSVLRRAGDTE